MKVKIFYGSNSPITLPRKFNNFIRENNIEIINIEVAGVPESFDHVCVVVSYIEVEKKTNYTLDIVGPCRNDGIDAKVKGLLMKKDMKFVKVAGCKDSFYVVLVSII